MQEFSSISVSSYEAESLSDHLTEKSAAGWSVVAVVPAGSQVVAYLSRDTSGEAWRVAVMESAFVSDADAKAQAVTSPVADEPVVEEIVADPVTEAPGWATTAVADPDPEPAVVTPEPTPEPTPVVAAAATKPAAATTPAAAPAGWYADPSARYDLRYWDGSEWTEHVSRNGQQATDPPVA